jgi:heme-degrading monooxygenase HmoA
MNGPGFVAIYRWRVAAEHEAAFIARWEQATLRLRTFGGMGSLLGRATSGEMVAVALWPSAEARDRAFAAQEAEDAPEWPPAERLEPILLHPIANLWETGDGDETT